MNIVVGVFTAFILSLILTPLFVFVARRLSILDRPAPDKVHSQPTPLLGGAAVLVSFFIVVLIAAKGLDHTYKALFIAGAIIFITGLIDDIRPFSPLKRLLIQIAAVVVLLVYGDIYFTFLPNTIPGKIGEIALTMIWIVGITNAFNCLDGLNGLAAGVAIIIAMFFSIFAGMTGQPALSYILAVIIGACAGFFPYNFFEGRIFLGNCGSMWLGFTLAGLAVIGEWAVGNPVDLIIPILIFGVPIFDMTNTTTIRILDKRTKNMVELLTYRGKDHFHHRLSQIGLGSKGAVFFIYVVCIMMSLNALLLALSQEFINVFIILCISVLFFLLISFLITVKRNHEI